MNPFHILWRRLRSLGQERAVRREIDEELRFHLEQRTAENIAAGMSPDEAAREARKRFGNVQGVREQCREVRAASFGETALQDVRFGLRMLQKNPGFTAVAVATLALGIGANTAIFSAVNAVLLKPLPYPEVERIVLLWTDFPPAKLGVAELPAMATDLSEWRRRARSFEHIGGMSTRNADLSAEGDPERVGGVEVTANFFSLLGTPPLLGRHFSAEEDQPGQDKVVIISHGLWRRRFVGDTNIIGRLITVNRERRMVVGVMPPEFQFPQGATLPAGYGLLPETDVWLPMARGPEFWQNDNSRNIIALGRVKPGVSLAQAQAEMDAIARQQAEELPDTHAGWLSNVRPLALQVASKTRSILLVLVAAVTFILLIACANVANLLLSRSMVRRKEMTVRAAIGAGRWRMIRQLLTESIVLSVIGGAFGLLLGAWAVELILKFSPSNIPRLDEVVLDGHVLAFTVFLSLATSVVFGLAPAWHTSRVNLTEALNAGGRSGIAGAGHRVQTLLVVTEVALAVILLTGAGLMVQSFLRIQAVDPGFNPQRVAAFTVSLFGDQYEGKARMCQFYRNTRERLVRLPGVRAVGAISNLPLGGSEHVEGLIIEGAPLPRPGEVVPTDSRDVTPGYFEAIGVTLLQGRDFDERDTFDRPVTCIINETLARSFFAGQDPLGKRLRLGDGSPDEANNPFYTIVGVARDVRGYALEVKPRPAVYLAVEQSNPRNEMTFVVRADLASVAALEKAIRSEMKALDATLPVAEFRTMEALVAKAIARPRFSAFLLGLFAGTALLLTVIGLYGVVAYAVNQRTREIGVRMALGASARNILALVFRQGMLPALAGLAIGIVGARALTRVLSSQLYEVKPTDPATFLAVALLLLFVTLLACWLPARRAIGIDPMSALRCE